MLKMCGMYVEVIEDSIDAGEFLQGSSYYQQHSIFLSPYSAPSPPAPQPPSEPLLGELYHFLSLRLGRGLDRRGGGQTPLA